MDTVQLTKKQPQKGPTWTCHCFKDDVYLCNDVVDKIRIEQPGAIYQIAIGSMKICKVYIDHFHCKWCRKVCLSSNITLMQKVHGASIIPYIPNKSCAELKEWKSYNYK